MGQVWGRCGGGWWCRGGSRSSQTLGTQGWGSDLMESTCSTFSPAPLATLCNNEWLGSEGAVRSLTQGSPKGAYFYVRFVPVKKERELSCKSISGLTLYVCCGSRKSGAQTARGSWGRVLFLPLSILKDFSFPVRIDQQIYR